MTSPDPTQWLRTTLTGTLAGRNLEAALKAAEARGAADELEFLAKIIKRQPNGENLAMRFRERAQALRTLSERHDDGDQI